MLDRVWAQMREVTELRFQARSHSATGWTGDGQGAVEVCPEGDHVLLFRESGQWTSATGREFSFSNVYRWTRDDTLLYLAHLRYGCHRPEELFALPVEGDYLESVCPHL